MEFSVTPGTFWDTMIIRSCWILSELICLIVKTASTETSHIPTHVSFDK